MRTNTVSTRPESSAARRRRLTRDRVRTLRLYEAAVLAGHPKALRAEALRGPRLELRRLKAEKRKLPPAERERLKYAPAHERLSSSRLKGLHDACVAARNDRSARDEFRALRGEIIAEVEAMFD